MKKLRLNLHLLQPHVVPFFLLRELHANTNSEKANEACRLFPVHSNRRMYWQHRIGLGSLTGYIGEAMDEPPFSLAFVMHHRPASILGFFGGKPKTRFFVPAITNGNTARVKYLANQCLRWWSARWLPFARMLKILCKKCEHRQSQFDFLNNAIFKGSCATPLRSPLLIWLEDFQHGGE